MKQAAQWLKESSKWNSTYSATPNPTTVLHQA
jgi:hypothetical protein